MELESSSKHLDTQVAKTKKPSKQKDPTFIPSGILKREPDEEVKKQRNKKKGSKSVSFVEESEVQSK